MKKQIKTILNPIKLAVGSLLLALLMVVNIQIGLNDSEGVDIEGLLNMDAAVYTPAAVATSSGWAHVDCGPDVHDLCSGDVSYTCCK